MKKLLTIITVTIISLIGLISVNAAEISYTGQFRLQYYSLSNGDSALTTVGNFNTGQTLSSGYGVSKVIARYTSTFTTGTIYRVSTIVGFAPSEIASSFRVVDSIGCFGTTSSSNWNADSSLVTCDIVGVSQIPNTNRVKYIIDITPVSNVAGIQFNINYAFTEEVRTVNVYTASTITTGPDIAGSIDEQTAAMEQGFEDISNQINQANENLINSITEQNQVCEMIDKNYMEIEGKYLNSQGVEGIANGTGITRYIKVSDKDKLKMLYNAQYNYMCFYNINKVKISCIAISSVADNTDITIPQNSSYMRVSLVVQSNRPILQLCKNGNQAIIDQDHNYTTDDSINDTVDQEHELQEDILDSLDNSYMDDWEMDLSGDSPNYVYNKMTAIYGINQKWIAFITTVLGLGIIKLILNR